jgi:hypothetical protein
LEKLKRDGKDPQALQTKPDLIEGAAKYFVAFTALNASRQMGMDGPGPIPISEVYAYCGMFNITSYSERFDMFRFISVCDGTYLKKLEVKRGRSSSRPPSAHGLKGVRNRG